MAERAWHEPGADAVPNSGGGEQSPGAPMTDADDPRPSPDALLDAAMRERRGRLRVFFGAAPGVGKTYAMLEAARRLKAEGTDVVIGIVETHGRVETEALLAGLEAIPRRAVAYKGRMLEEMDIDTILARRPKVALVDELAHTNAPGSRHAKRYSDVEEILAAGIDVFTTLNVQHLDSLNDVVAQITRIRVRETVPDRILEAADEVEVIDLTPDDLIKRLNEGKVYVREQAQRALKHYFAPGNLTALRELALRRTAQRVDEQMVSYMQTHAIQGPWAAGERVMVCVSADRSASGCVRYAKRMADRMRTRFTALHVETVADAAHSEDERDRIAEALRLAEQLGGEALTIPGRAVVDEILAFARANNIAHVIVGRAESSGWERWLRGSVVHDLVRQAGAVSVHVVAGEAVDTAATPAKLRAKAETQRFDPWPYVESLAMVAGAGLGAAVVRGLLQVQNLSLVFIVAVLGSAIRHGYTASLITSFLCVAVYNFFFLPPLYTFTIADPGNLVALVFFTIVAVLTSRLTARMRAQTEIASARARVTARMSSFARKLAGIGALDDLLWATAHQIALLLKVRVVLLLPDETRTLSVRAGYPPEDELDEMDLAAAQWSFSAGRIAGRGASTLPGTRRLFLPVRTESRVLGVAGLDSDEPGPLLTPDQRRLLDAILDQAAVALERVELMRDIDRARLDSETERLRSAMLTSLSHDLRTPLSAIIGTATALEEGDGLDPASRRQLLRDLRFEAERMGRFVRNLLDMTRLEAGLALKSEATDLADVVRTARQRASALLGERRVSVTLAPDLPLLKADYLLLEQVVFNLLDNAAKFTAPDGHIAVAAERRGRHVAIRVSDDGIGIPDEDREKVFDKFYRIEARDHRRAGTGLGLAICRGFMTAMGGTIRALPSEHGAVFELTLPIDEALDAFAVEGD
jgi:two-component system, OmpR family, sensor histidine kinase KdpD